MDWLNSQGVGQLTLDINIHFTFIIELDKVKGGGKRRFPPPFTLNYSKQYRGFVVTSPTTIPSFVQDVYNTQSIAFGLIKFLFSIIANKGSKYCRYL